MGLPAHETLLGVFRFKLHCLQIFSLKHHISGVEYGKTTLSSDLQMLKFDLQTFSLKNSLNMANLQSSGKPAGSPIYSLYNYNLYCYSKLVQL